MPDDHPEIVARLLVFIYTGQYAISWVPQWRCDGTAPFENVPVMDITVDRSGNSKPLIDTWHRRCVVAIKMYQIADKTLVDDMRWASRDKFLAFLRPDRDDESEGRRFWAKEEMRDVVTIIKLAYESTRSDDWMLHDSIVHRMLVGIQYYDCLKWELCQKLLRDVLSLAVEIATSQLATRRMATKCRVCGKKTQQRLWRCRCGQMNFCEDTQCTKLRKQRSICDTCAVFGTC